MTDLEKLKEKASAMPASPGVYLMKDARGRVIYVGKAKSLPKRVTTYFQKNHPSPRTTIMVSQVRDVDYIVTDNEKEALILENSLIKKHKPRYNVVLRDDKTYPSLRLTVQEEYPRLEVVRRIKKDGAVYFGPFTSATAMRQTIRVLRRLFPLRQCKRPDVKAVERPCLNYQVGRCYGPCGGHISPEDYRAMVDEVILFFQGRNNKLTESLKTRMKEAAANLDFELAARYRDRLEDVKKTLGRQTVLSTDLKDKDVIGLARDRGQVLALIMFIRQGALLGSREFPLGGGDDPDKIVEALIGQYYSRDNYIPDEILSPFKLENSEVIVEWLNQKRGKSVHLPAPQRGPKKKLIDMAAHNAETALAERLRAAELGGDALAELKEKLRLPRLPRRIEGFDMATLHGDSAAGAMVVLEDGDWNKSEYRRYKIKASSGRDDYAMMSEVLERRLVKEELPTPDLILLDGGRGQLSVTMAVIEDLGLEEPPPIAGLAKGRNGDQDKVYLPGRKNPVDFKADSPALMLLMRIRDEAHRYVRTYHHRMRSKKSSKSTLENIPGIGPERRKVLLKHFGSMDAIKKATVDELAGVKGMTRKAAVELVEYYKE